MSVTHDGTRITWTIRPALFLPLAHRQGSELPACAHDFKPHPTGRVTTFSTGSRRLAHRTRPGPRPGLRSCLRPAPARPASGPRAQQSAALNLMNRGVFTGSAQCVTGSPSTAASTGVRRCCRQLVPSDRRALLAKAYANRNLPSGDWVRRCCYRELCSPSLSLKQHGLAALFRWHG